MGSEGIHLNWTNSNNTEIYYININGECDDDDVGPFMRTHQTARHTYACTHIYINTMALNCVCREVKYKVRVAVLQRKWGVQEVRAICDVCSAFFYSLTHTLSLFSLRTSHWPSSFPILKCSFCNNKQRQQHNKQHQEERKKCNEMSE